MTKPADDKLAHAKREIKALTGQLAEAKEQYELLEALEQWRSYRNTFDGELIDTLQAQIKAMSHDFESVIKKAEGGL
jgi:hypothetical protein